MMSGELSGKLSGLYKIYFRSTVFTLNFNAPSPNSHSSGTFLEQLERKNPKTQHTTILNNSTFILES
jgi:hypothetical protein